MTMIPRPRNVGVVPGLLLTLLGSTSLFAAAEEAPRGPWTGKGWRYTDPESTFRANLRRYVRDAWKVKARPILITPVTRRHFHPDGRVRTILRPYAEATTAVGKELSVPLIDLHARSVALFERLGDAGSADLSCNWKDRTHFLDKGARTIARLVAEGLHERVPELASYLRPLDRTTK